MLYDDPVEFMPLETLKYESHPTLAERFAEEWELFESDDDARKVLSLCLDDHHPKHNPDQSMLDPDRQVYDQENWQLGEYALVQELREWWSSLKDEVRHENRYFLKNSINEIGDHIWVAEMTIGKRSALYRARGAPEKGAFTAREMGSPPPTKATAGRVNPLAISYLYLASDEVTAASELRPHVDDEIYVSRFRLSRDAKIVDFRSPLVGSPFRWGNRLREVVRIIPFLNELGREMSRPVSNARRDIDYLPTQYLCEWIKSKGYDGVAYESGVSKGWNLALFDSTLAHAGRPHRRRVAGVTVDLKTM
ncbi:MAG: RES family NAD+ phosphorylase [Nannocystales bacterium]